MWQGPATCEGLTSSVEKTEYGWQADTHGGDDSPLELAEYLLPWWKMENRANLHLPNGRTDTLRLMCQPMDTGRAPSPLGWGNKWKR